MSRVSGASARCHEDATRKLLPWNSRLWEEGRVVGAGAAGRGGTVTNERLPRNESRPSGRMAERTRDRGSAVGRRQISRSDDDDGGGGGGEAGRVIIYVPSSIFVALSLSSLQPRRDATSLPSGWCVYGRLSKEWIPSPPPAPPWSGPALCEFL